jgi:nicotinamide-nucleotide amidase
MSEADEILYRLARAVGECLAERGLRLTVAESCTGGWICQCLTDVAGSSAWFEGGFVTYSNEAKRELLGVPDEVLAGYGAVSEATARAMAAGALCHGRADLALAVSGIAGPGGAVPGKPVGTVWFAWETRAGERVARRKRFAGDRRAVRRQAVAEALRGVLTLYERQELA